MSDSDKTPEGRKWLNGKEAADYAGISRTTFYAWMREGKLPFRCYPIAHRIKRFSQIDIDRWLESIHREPGKGPVYPRKRKGKEAAHEKVATQTGPGGLAATQFVPRTATVNKRSGGV